MSSATKVLKGELTVSALMSRELVTVPLGTPLAKVVTLLTEGHSRHVLVVDSHGALVGVVADRDVLRHVIPGVTDSTWENKSVESVMLTKFATSSPDASPSDLAGVLVDGSIQCLPILEGNKLVGVMTSGDLLMSWNRLRPALQQAGVDHLTGLANRATFDRRLTEELDRSRRQNASLAVILCDVDHFKEINETCGHPTGDAVLRLVADCLSRHLRVYDVLARFGGDEFAAICSCCGPSEIESPIDRVQNAVHSMVVPLDGGRRGISLSIGAAIARPTLSNVTIDRLVRAADQCLYDAKQGGRDRVRIAELSDSETEHKRNVIANHPMDSDLLLDSLLHGV
jgi:diguanylate cyclase (GGDEF)-like protein